MQSRQRHPLPGHAVDGNAVVKHALYGAVGGGVCRGAVVHDAPARQHTHMIRLQRQRLDTPYVRRDGRLQPASWAEAFAAIAAKLKGVSGSRVAALAGDLADCEAMTALKDLMTALGSPNLDCRQDGAKLDASVRASYLFNSTIAGIEQADALLLIGTNPRAEASVINARIRKRWRRGGFKVASVGPKVIG